MECSVSGTMTHAQGTQMTCAYSSSIIFRLNSFLFGASSQKPTEKYPCIGSVCMRVEENKMANTTKEKCAKVYAWRKSESNIQYEATLTTKQHSKVFKVDSLVVALFAVAKRAAPAILVTFFVCSWDRVATFFANAHSHRFKSEHQIVYI